MIEKIPQMETIKTTAKIFGLPENFIRQKVIHGEVVAVKAGCKYLVNVDKFAEYLNNSTVDVTNIEKASDNAISPVPIKL